MALGLEWGIDSERIDSERIDSERIDSERIDSEPLITSPLVSQGITSPPLIVIGSALAHPWPGRRWNK